MTAEIVSKRLVQQRIRNRIIEYFQIVVEYEADPGVLDLNDVVNEWEMNVGHPFVPTELPAPTFTPEEIDSVLRFDRAWHGLCNATPPTIEDEKKTLVLPAWATLKSEASAALIVFGKRGKLSEETEVS